MPSETDFNELAGEMTGSLRRDLTHRVIYSTDASVYQQEPIAVAFPANEPDLRRLIDFANRHGVGLIPRTAGTSLAGQVVGAGIVVDISRHMTQILEIDADAKLVRVQPGVIRNELNLALKPHGLMFGPETSTADRAMLGGMLGNNSTGANSLVYGSTRDQTVEVKGFLSDGSLVSFGPLSKREFEREATRARGESGDLKARIYSGTARLLGAPEVRRRIEQQFPKPEIKRRNTGYAIDRLIDNVAFGGADRPFNFCDLIAGSEGSLLIATEITLRCHPLPLPDLVLCCVHFRSVAEALRAVPVALRHRPDACELIDHLVLEGAARNLEQRRNRAFVEGEPAALLMVELRATNEGAARQMAAALVAELKSAGMGFAHPVLHGAEAGKAWELRRAGLGVVNNVPGDTKPVTLIEDVAVAASDLESYIADVNELLSNKYGVTCVHYAHAGAGELHLRPLLNLKTKKGRADFRNIATDVAKLVKKYRGSLSGEHGDGRLRAEFLEQMIGPENYELVKAIKHLWDPNGLFNPGKIVSAPPMDSALRVRDHDFNEGETGGPSTEWPTVFDFSNSGGILGAAEMCSGSGDCRKTELAGGTMCPSYQATRDERDSTRARANLLRHVMMAPKNGELPFADSDAKEILDLCLSCKGCKSECPSNVDMARLKAEFLQGYYDAHGVPLRARTIANGFRWIGKAKLLRRLINKLATSRLTGPIAKRVAGFHPKRMIPPLAPQTLREWFLRRGGPGNRALEQTRRPNPKKVFLFCDEFTNFLEPAVGIAAVELLEQLGWEVAWVEHVESGRAALSCGLIREAKKLAEQNVEIFSSVVTAESPLIGIEPSALLSFRDEYPDLVGPALKSKATELAKHTMLIDEFLAGLVRSGELSSEAFTQERAVIRLHGHCHQKALSKIADTELILSLPENYSVETIASGCCGMAGAFGMEREHYELSMQIGELVLFPAVRNAADEIVVATGTSCRQQIKDGTGRVARHPVEILRMALRVEKV